MRRMSQRTNRKSRSDNQLFMADDGGHEEGLELMTLKSVQSLSEISLWGYIVDYASGGRIVADEEAGKSTEKMGLTLKE